MIRSTAAKLVMKATDRRGTQARFLDLPSVGITHWMAAMTPGVSTAPGHNLEISGQGPEGPAAGIAQEPALELLILELRPDFYNNRDFYRHS
jgi:hypothetical protein